MSNICQAGWAPHTTYNTLNTDKGIKINKLGQAQVKLGFDFTLTFCRLGSSRFGLVESVGRFSFIGLIENTWLIILSNPQPQHNGWV